MTKLTTKTQGWLKRTWTRTKAWFKHSETIFLARLYALIGAITTFVGSMDFSPFWDTFKTGTWLTSREVITIGIGILGSGIAFEIARRRNMSK